MSSTKSTALPLFSAALGVAVMLISAFCVSGASPDGVIRELAVKSAGEGLAVVGVRSWRVFILPFGAEQVEKTSTHEFDSAFFSSDGTKVIWVTAAGLSMETVSGSPVGELRGEFTNVSNLSLAPDGNQVVFDTRNRAAPPPNSGLQYGRFREGSVDLLSPVGPGADRAGDPVHSMGLGWSADSKFITYERDNAVFKMDVRSRQTVLLADGRKPTWSPDGKWIAYLANDGSARLLTPDGASERRIMEGRKPVGTLHWSPDSEYLMFAEAYTPGPLEFLSKPLGSNTRLVILRLRDSATVPIYWFGLKGGSDSYFAWIKGYNMFCAGNK